MRLDLILFFFLSLFSLLMTHFSVLLRRRQRGREEGVVTEGQLNSSTSTDRQEETDRQVGGKVAVKNYRRQPQLVNSVFCITQRTRTVIWVLLVHSSLKMRMSVYMCVHVCTRIVHGPGKKNIYIWKEDEWGVRWGVCANFQLRRYTVCVRLSEVQCLLNWK